MNHIPVSQRAKNTPASPIRKLTPSAKKAKEKGVRVYHLNIGQPDFPAPPEFLKQLKGFSQKEVTYAPSEGLSEMVDAWKTYYHSHAIPFEKEDIIVTTGGSEAILFALMAVADPGDELIIFEPLYTNYLTFAQETSVKLVPITTYLKNGFHIPNNPEIEKKITSKTKGIIICNPSNPTGTVYKRSELKRIAEIAEKHNLFVISDEVYREFVFKVRSISMMEFSFIREQLVIIDSISKRFNLCGARVGCLASKNKKIVEAALKFAQGRLASPTIEQLSAVPLLKSYRKYTKSVVEEYRKRKNAVISVLKTIPGVKFYLPEGAFYLIAELPIRDAEYFCRWLLEEFQDQGETVMFAPAQGFYQTPQLGIKEIRIAFVLESKKLKRSMEILKIALEEYKK